MPVPPDDTLPAESVASSSQTAAPPTALSTADVLGKFKQLQVDAAQEGADGEEDDNDEEVDMDETGGKEGTGGASGAGGDGNKKKKKKKGKATKAIAKLK